MRKFRFIGDSSNWEWEINPVHGFIYSMEQLNKMRCGDPVDDDFMDCRWGKENFEEILYYYENLGASVKDIKKVENFWGTPMPWTSENHFHKDTDLGYFAGLVLQGILANSKKDDYPKELARESILIAKELIKQLDQENK